MRATKGALSHEDILRMPWRTFVGYLVAIREEEEETADAMQRLDGGRDNGALLEDRDEHIRAWREQQPPPKEVG